MGTATARAGNSRSRKSSGLQRSAAAEPVHLMKKICSHSPTLKKERISEDGRRFLAERLALLSRDQLFALAEASRADLRDEEIEEPDGTHRKVTLEDRVDQFERHMKRDILHHHCPPAPRD